MLLFLLKSITLTGTMNLRKINKRKILCLSDRKRSKILKEFLPTESEIVFLESVPSTVVNLGINFDAIILDNSVSANWELEWEKIKEEDLLNTTPCILVSKGRLGTEEIISLIEKGFFGVVSNEQIDELFLMCTSAIFQGVVINEERLKSNELNRILSTNYLILDSKNRMLELVKKKLDTIIDAQNEIKVKDLKLLATEIEQKLKKEHHYELFKVHFQEVHPLFYKKLLKVNGDLTDNNLKLLAFLKIGFNNNEISFLLNISISAVKKSIQRLKPKLNLVANDSLRKYIFEL